MEKFFALLKLGIKYLYRYRRRYRFLLAALVFCFAIVTLITSLKDGMYDSVYYTAQSHYAGDIITLGFYSDTTRKYLGQHEISAILDAAQSSGLNPKKTVKRTFGLSSRVYYNGTMVELKYLQGCDWDNEADLFSRMKYEGEPQYPFGDDGIVLSTPIAKELHANIGDRVTVETDTKTKQRNTGYFILKAIVQDTSIFGYYKAYVSRVSLNHLLVYDDGDCSSLGFYLADPNTAEQKRLDLQKALGEKTLTGDLVYNRDELNKETDKKWDGVKVMVLTLPVYLSEVSDLLNAMNIITYVLYGMMCLIILVSAAVTYRLILHERTKEMGIMRTIGFYGKDLNMVLWTEIITLGFISLLVGFIFAWLLSMALSLVSFSWFPSFEIFMKNGRLTALYRPLTVVFNIIFIFLILGFAAFSPVFRASRKDLSGLLSGEPL